MTDTASAAPSLLPCPFCGSGRIERNCMTPSDVACLDCDALAPSAATWSRRAQPTPPAVVESPDFTDTARAALLWVLWHHQGGSSPVGQPIRFALGMGQHDRLNEHQLSEAKRWEKLHPVNPAVWPNGQKPLSKEHRRALLDQLGDTAEGMDGETWDQMVIDAVEAAHGIGIKKGEGHDKR